VGGFLAMKISINLAALGRTRWYEYALRFFFGGAITLATGLIAQKYGPAVGGLFLAFPAIFPASATLIEKHEKQKKETKGLHGIQRGRVVAGLDAAGATMGSFGLLFFGFISWLALPHFHPSIVLLGATLGWLVLSFFVWRLRKTGVLLSGRGIRTRENP
jgi:hypothetical protein